MLLLQAIHQQYLFIHDHTSRNLIRHLNHGKIQRPALIMQQMFAYLTAYHTSADNQHVTAKDQLIISQQLPCPNAMLCKAAFPEANIVIDAALCACVTPESHDTALNAMRLCQMEILHQGEEPWRK